MKRASTLREDLAWVASASLHMVASVFARPDDRRIFIKGAIGLALFIIAVLIIARDVLASWLAPS